jgi:hypothetical protein
MAFADPQKVKVDGTNEVELPRVDTGSFASQYLSSDGTISLKLSTQNGKRKRHVARIDLSKITTDPYDTSQNMEVGSSIYLVVDRPIAGYTNEELRKAVEGLVAFLSASTYSSTKKLLGSES